MDGVFVIGVDTGVGKTIVCAGLLKLLQGTRKAVYWKPVQTGTIVGDDTRAVKSLTELPAENFWDPCYRFPEPLSPHMAAQKWGKPVDMSVLSARFKKRTDEFVIIEGAGGLLVPFNSKELQMDFIKLTGLPVVIVTEDRVGAINQTLLTLNAARAAGIAIVGVVMTRARRTLGNSEAIREFGKVEVLAELDPSEDARSLIAQVIGHDRLRKLVSVDQLPQ